MIQDEITGGDHADEFPVITYWDGTYVERFHFLSSLGLHCCEVCKICLSDYGDIEGERRESAFMTARAGSVDPDGGLIITGVEMQHPALAGAERQRANGSTVPAGFVGPGFVDAAS